MDADKPSKKARLREARIQLKESLAAQRALARRVAELETLRASTGRPEALDAGEFFDLATRLASAERALRAALEAGADATEASKATQTLLAAAGDRLAELGSVADRADLAEDRLAEATATIEDLRQELTDSLASLDEARDAAARLSVKVEESVAKAVESLAKAEASEKAAEQSPRGRGTAPRGARAGEHEGRGRRAPAERRAGAR